MWQTGTPAVGGAQAGHLALGVARHALPVITGPGGGCPAGQLVAGVNAALQQQQCRLLGKHLPRVCKSHPSISTPENSVLDLASSKA